MDLKTSDFNVIYTEVACHFHFVYLYVIYQKFRSNLTVRKNIFPPVFSTTVFQMTVSQKLDLNCVWEVDEEGQVQDGTMTMGQDLHIHKEGQLWGVSALTARARTVLHPRAQRGAPCWAPGCLCPH